MKIPLQMEELQALHKEAAGRVVDVMQLLRAAHTAIKEDRFDDAETLLLGAAVAEPERAETWRLVGVLAEEFGELDEAELAYRRAFDLESNEEAALALASLFASDGRFEEAEGFATSLMLDATSARIRERAGQLVESVQERRSHA